MAILSSEPSGSDVYIVPDAEGAAAPPQVFAELDDSLADGVAFTAARCEIYVATENHVWRIPYHGERKASEVHKIADVRTGPEAPGTDGDVHNTTSVAFTDGHVYAAAGSSCNATMDYGKEPCTEVDPTRAAVSIMKPDGSDFLQRAKRVRNAIALAVNPDTAVALDRRCRPRQPSGRDIPTNISTIFRRIPAMPITAGPFARRTTTFTGEATIAEKPSLRWSSCPHTPR